MFTYSVTTDITVCQIKSKHNIHYILNACQELFTFSGAVDGPVMSSFGHLQHPCPQQVFIRAVCRCVTPRPFDQKQEQTKKRDTKLHLHRQRNFSPPKEQWKAQAARLFLRLNRCISCSLKVSTFLLKQTRLGTNLYGQDATPNPAHLFTHAHD